MLTFGPDGTGSPSDRIHPTSGGLGKSELAAHLRKTTTRTF